MGIDALAAQGVLNLGFHIAEEGYPSPKTCTLKNAAVRRELLARTLGILLPCSRFPAPPCLAPRSSTS
jgi:hypothetical protein